MLDFDGYLGNDSSTKRKPMTMAIHSKSALSNSWPKVKYNGLHKSGFSMFQHPWVPRMARPCLSKWSTQDWSRYGDGGTRWGPGSVFVLNDVEDEFTGPHMACYGSDPSFNSVTFSWGSLTVRLKTHLFSMMQTNFICKGTMRVPGVRIGMIKAPTRTAWACLDVIPKHSTPIYLLFSCIFTCFHDIETNRWDRSVQPCPYNAEWHDFWPVYELSLIGTSQLLPFTFSHTPIAQEKVFVGDRIIEVNGISKACSYTCWKDSETAAQVIFRCFVKYGDVVQFMHV